MLFMATKVAINGLGRIGRIVLRCWVARKFKDVEIVALNDLIPPEDMAYYVKYDSTHGKAPFEVKADSESLILDGVRVPMFAERDPTALPWKKLGVDIVMECTGRFTKKPDAGLGRLNLTNWAFKFCRVARRDKLKFNFGF